ncbi:hypothetical protein RND81_02G190100 [Saponaria officinalis]|uniref:DUF4283 domain-containing protein n=1 Tax=Saponaria officinalis TaxID=3572 RepID=A0AAW1MWQ8_SAPOF
MDPKKLASAGKTTGGPTIDGSTEVVENKKIISGVINDNNLQWLKRSCIAESAAPRDFEDIKQMLLSQWHSITKVCFLGPYIFIICFESVELIEEAMSKIELFSKYFVNMFPWNSYQQCKIRRIWLEIIGIPLQCWCRDTFEKIAAIWGSMVCLDTTIEKRENLMVGKMLLDTESLETIDEVIFMHVESLGFKIRVKECGNSTIMIRNPNLSDGRNRAGVLSSY